MDDPPTPDLPLLRKAVSWAEAEAAKTDGTGLWNQTVYRVDVGCGTAYCIAGWTVYEAMGMDVAAPLSVERVAQERLGLTSDEAWELFAVENSIERVRELAEAVAERAGERL